ncbi:hypothetical protein HMY34_13835 [Thiothrix subterranea]|uniref:hypothetical protein n=1 Tax=Thiothrix subterranea TaxID=2735563 RepID=UPI00192B7B5A|nr:hypothetical protein [Thiothrix subterranea]QQZ29766.1 hypothetical protein HMY34_13835 [Thiothrix subterranea]
MTCSTQTTQLHLADALAEQSIVGINPVLLVSECRKTSRLPPLGVIGFDGGFCSADDAQND